MKIYGRIYNWSLRALYIALLAVTLVCFQNCGQLEGTHSGTSVPSSETEGKDPSYSELPNNVDEDADEEIVEEVLPGAPNNPVVPMPPAPSGPVALTHGSQLTSAMVGPAAIGITSFTKIANDLALTDSNVSSVGVDVASTAVYDGVTVTGAHVLIQGKELSMLDIYSSKRIVLRGNKIRGTSFYSINVRNTAKGGIYVLHNDLGGHNATQFGSKAMNVMAPNFYAYRNYVSYSVDGINFTAGNATMIENFMHNFAGDASAHYDGITNYGGEDNVTILRNKVLLNKSDTGAFNIGAGDGSINNWVVDSNYIAGGGYTCYCGGESNGNQTSNFRFTNNIFGLDFYAKVGFWGPVTWEAPKTRGNVYQGNIYSNGNPLNF